MLATHKNKLSEDGKRRVTQREKICPMIENWDGNFNTAQWRNRSRSRHERDRSLRILGDRTFLLAIGISFMFTFTLGMLRITGKAGGEN